MSENKNGLQGKALKAAVLAGVGTAVLAFLIDIILNLITGRPAIETPGIIGIIIYILVVGSAAVGVYRNVLAGKPWYGDKKS